MRVRTKLILLLLSLSALFTASRYFFGTFEDKRVRVLLQAAIDDRSFTFDNLVKLKGSPIETVAYDYTLWDELVDFIHSNNLAWVKDNISENTLKTYQADAIWIYNLDFTEIYSVKSKQAADLKGLPAPVDAVSSILLKNRFCHFFVNTQAGLMEIQGATIHPILDAKRVTPPQGYFFCGRLWNKEYVDELEKLTRSTITVSTTEPARPNLKTLIKTNVIGFSKELPGWEGKPAAYLYVRIESRELESYKLFAKNALMIFAGFLVSVFIIMLISLKSLVSTPLSMISHVLETGKPANCPALEKDISEFGDIWRLICKFFEQKQELVKEIAERKDAEERLRTNEAWLSTTLRSIGDGVIATDSNGCIVFINNIAQVLTGYNKEEAIGKHLREIFNIVNEATGKAAYNPIERILSEGTIVGLGNHTILVSKNGAKYPIDDSAAPIKDGKGNVLGAVFVFRDVTERRRKEETNQRLAAIVQSSDDAIIGKTLDGIITSWNKGAEKIYGYREDEVINRPVFLLVPPGHKNDMQKILAKIRNNEHIEHLEAVRVKKGGQQINVSLTISPLYDANGNIIGASTIGRDITERKKMEAQLKESESKAKAILDQTFQFIGLMTIDGTLLEVNKAAADLVGTDGKEYLNKPFWDTPWWRHSPQLQDKLREAIKKVAMGELVRFEATHKAKDGSLHYVDFSLKPIKDATGKIIYMIPEGRDITERKAMEEKLAATAREWEATFNSITDFVSIQDKDSRLVKVNKAYADLFKTKPEALIGRKCYSVVHGINEPCFDCPHQNTLITKKASRLEYFEKRFDAYLEVSTSPMFDANGEVVGTIHTVKDITERKKIEKALKEAAELKSHFTSMVSHELRTPLTAIKESISIVMDGTAGELNEEQRGFLDISKRNVDRLARLINDVLDYQKLESGKFEFHFQENDINEIIKETENTMVSVAKEKGLDIILNLGSNLPKIQCDKDKIIQVLTNLLSNAIKFTEKGSITIISEKRDNAIELKIKDAGIGIKNEDLPRLFHAFEQLGKGNERKTGSTGLGLAISKEIIDKHKGKIWVESELGKGSAFHIILPITERRV